MTPRLLPFLTLMTLTSAALLLGSPVSAKDLAPVKPSDEDETATPEAAKPDAPAGEAGSADDPAAEATRKDAAKVAEAEAGDSPVELKGKTYYGVGLRYRAVIVPKFMINLFGDGGRTVVANGFGPEFTIRKDGFEYDFAAWYASYAMDPTPFKASSDPRYAWELVESRIKVLYLTSDFLWSHELAPQFALNYGFGAGFGLVWGDLIRTQAYPGSAAANDSTGQGYLPCASPGVPDAAFCDDTGHYGSNEPSWANGGSKPIIFPWLALQTGFRYKPYKNFIARFDAGFGTSGFFLGLGADYGL